MIKMSSLKRMRVLSLQEGEQLGQVRDLILDPAAGQVVALVLNERTSAGEPQVVATANVRNVGEAAITIEDRGRLVPLSRIPRFKELARARKSIHGRQVLSESGTRLGYIADLELELPSFRIASFLLKGPLFGRGRTLPAGQVRTIGADAVVVRDELAGEGKPAWPSPTPAPSVAVPPVEARVEPVPLPRGVGPAPISAEPAHEAEPAIPSVSPLAEPLVQIPAEAPPPVPTAEPAPPAEPLAPAEALPPAAEPEPAAASGEAAPAPGPAEPAAKEGPAQAAENPWQRWVRRLRHREEDK
jgi:uncharacterized protein YrrD